MNTIFSLKDKIAIVTGGYSHLGYAMTMILESFGAKVYVAGRSQEKFSKSFKSNNNIKFIEIDISEFTSIDEGFKKVYQEEGKIDILINNAFYAPSNHPEKMTNEEWESGIDGSLNSVFRSIKSVVPFMKNNGGKIINISSMYGVVVPDLEVYDCKEESLNPPNYGTAKAAVLHLTKYYAMYLAKYNINVNAISPGPFPSTEVQGNKHFISKLEGKVPLKRIGNPKDLNGIIALLASDASNYITGQNISVDGGWTL